MPVVHGARDVGVLHRITHLVGDRARHVELLVMVGREVALVEVLRTLDIVGCGVCAAGEPESTG